MRCAEDVGKGNVVPTYHRNQNLVASGNAHGETLAILVEGTGANSEDLGLVELLDTALREEDTGGGLGLGLDALDQDAVQEGGKSLDVTDGRLLTLGLVQCLASRGVLIRLSLGKEKMRGRAPRPIQLAKKLGYGHRVVLSLELNISRTIVMGREVLRSRGDVRGMEKGRGSVRGRKIWTFAARNFQNAKTTALVPRNIGEPESNNLIGPIETEISRP